MAMTKTAPDSNNFPKYLMVDLSDTIYSYYSARFLQHRLLGDQLVKPPTRLGYQ
jgi:hypothetical protein